MPIKRSSFLIMLQIKYFSAVSFCLTGKEPLRSTSLFLKISVLRASVVKWLAESHTAGRGWGCHQGWSLLVHMRLCPPFHPLLSLPQLIPCLPAPCILRLASLLPFLLSLLLLRNLTLTIICTYSPLIHIKLIFNHPSIPSCIFHNKCC